MDASASADTQVDRRRSTPQLRAVLICDLADSTALVERLGDAAAADLMRRHDRVARDLLHAHGGREIDKTDGFLVLFERPVQAVAFALAYQRGLKSLGEQRQQTLRARIGIHVGEVVLWDNEAADIADGAKPVEVEGLAKPVAARLMGLALPGQILLSEIARTLAQRAQSELPDAAHLRWIAHGRYRFKGVPAPLMIHEVGEPGVARFAPPQSGAKAQRELPWWRRPAALALELGLLVAGVSIPIYLSLRPEAAIAFAERDWVVVADLSNLTTQPLLSDSLDVAMRIGLEQSRYVNVVPNTAVRETLKRMRRPADSQIDRALGVEIAQREGARALILPSVAEVGGRVRVTAEIIDPGSGETVYSEAVGGEGLDTVLESTDELLSRLRGRLGESLDAVQRDFQPLARITTTSLDALKAFALGEEALGQGRIQDAMALMAQAISIDPEFAMAHARLSTMHHALGDDVAAYRSAQKAIELKESLSTRERLMLEGVTAFYFDPALAREKWSTVLSMYPDIAVARNNIGLAYMWYENDAPRAAAAFKVFTEGNSHLRGYGWLGLCVAQTLMGDLDQARASATEAERFGVLAPNFDDVLMHIAARDYAAAVARLDAASTSLPPPFALERGLRKAAIALDQGRHAEALDLLRRAREDLPEGFLEASVQRVRLHEAAVALALDVDDGLVRLRDLVQHEIARTESAAAAFDRSPPMHLTLAALMAQRHGDATLAQRALDAARLHATEASAPPTARLWRAAACEVEHADDLDERLRCLAALVNGTEYFQIRYAQFTALAAAGRGQEALQQAEWLLANRGRALAELQKLDAQFLNLTSLNDALLARTEQLSALGRVDEAKAALAAIEVAWPQVPDAESLARRLRSLQLASGRQQDDQP